MEFLFRFDINPTPASRPRITRWTTYYGAKYQAFKDEMAIMVSNAWKGKEPIEGPIFVETVYHVPIAKGVPQKKRDLLDGTWCQLNIDIDNLDKALYDSLNKIIYLDDKQIVWHNNIKIWTSGYGKIVIKLKTLAQLTLK